MPTAMKKVKLKGPRSIASKLHRLAYELEADASRVRADYPGERYTSDSILAISSSLGKLARRMEQE